MQIITKEQFDNHQLWLNTRFSKSVQGKRLDLSGADLSDADLSEANLKHANLSEANLKHANLSEANLKHANLKHANLRYANLKHANLRYAYLSDANLKHANLKHANLRYAYLSDANLKHANLRYANLSDANLSGANLSDANLTEAINISKLVEAQLIICPSYGSFYGFKKLKHDCIALLFIPEHAERSSATSRKCRCSEARIENIWDEKGNEISEGFSNYDKCFVYKVNETIKSDKWDENRWYECSHGIHFFITREEAEAYTY